MRAPNYLTAAQIIHAIRVLMTPDLSWQGVEWACHTQRIKREMIKRGAIKWHGVLMLDSTKATQFIASHASEDAQNPAKRPQGVDVQPLPTQQVTP